MSSAKATYPEQLVQYNSTKNEIMVFDTPTKFVNLIEKHRLYNGDSYWSGESTQDCAKYTRIGNTKLVPEAERIIAKLQTNLPDLQPSWSSDIAGDMVVVPEYIVGLPEHMRRKIPNETQGAPLRVLFDTTSSGGIGHGILTIRGTTVLALLMRLIVERPVEFWLVGIYDCPQDIAVMVRVPTTPLNLGLATHLLTSGAITRSFMYGIAHSLGWSGGWNQSYKRKGGIKSGKDLTEAMRKFFDAGNTDLMIPPAIYGYQDCNEDVWKQPLKWINERLSEGRIYEEAA